MVDDCASVLLGGGVSGKGVEVVLRGSVETAGAALKIDHLVDLGTGSFDEEAQEVVELVGEDGGGKLHIGLADNTPRLHREGGTGLLAHLVELVLKVSAESVASFGKEVFNVEEVSASKQHGFVAHPVVPVLGIDAGCQEVSVCL